MSIASLPKVRMGTNKPLHQKGWMEDLIRREETASAIDVVEGRPRNQPKGRVDYVLRIKINPNS